MNQSNDSENNVNGTRSSNGEGVTFGRGSGGQQPDFGRHQATARMKWNKEVNKIVMRCFYRSEPAKRGYRKRMLSIWNELGVFEITEQRLADQERAIRTNEWLSEIELEKIKRKIESDHAEIDVRITGSSDDPAQRIEHEATDDTGEHETAAENDNNELSVKDICDT